MGSLVIGRSHFTAASPSRDPGPGRRAAPACATRSRGGAWPRRRPRTCRGARSLPRAWRAPRGRSDLVEAPLAGDALVVREIDVGDTEPDSWAQPRERPAVLVGGRAQ